MTPSTDHERLADLVASVAIGAATPDESASVERHAATCPICAEELDSLRVTAGMLALGAPQLIPPPSLKREVLASVRAERNLRAPVMKPARRVSIRLWPSLAGALAAAVVGLGAWNLSLQTSSPGTEKLASVQFATAVTGDARVKTTAGRRVAVMRLNGLGPQDAARGYEVWVIPSGGGAPLSRGFMQPEGNGSYVAVVDVSDSDALAVTPEPRTNTAAPSGEKVAVFST